MIDKLGQVGIKAHPFLPGVTCLQDLAPPVELDTPVTTTLFVIGVVLLVLAIVARAIGVVRRRKRQTTAG